MTEKTTIRKEELEILTPRFFHPPFNLGIRQIQDWIVGGLICRMIGVQAVF